MKQEYHTSQTGGITFSWEEIECEQRNGALLGYEINLHYDEIVHTVKVFKPITAFTIPPLFITQSRYPNAISVAAINQVGVGIHCPPVSIIQSG